MVGSGSRGASGRFTPSWDDGRYVLGERLGEGAAGVVHRALEVATGRVVAVKWLRAGATDPARAQRFAREGEALAGLSHPGIVRVHAGGVAAGRPFLVMELVEGGRTLGAVAPGLPLGRRLELVCDVARALGHAHAQGLVHRDVKPDNVLVDQAGVARVADFGLALGVDHERLTKTGAVLGTPSYMAPEQWAGRDVGPPADVWSLGVVLYELVAGQLPFQGESWVELMAALERPPVPPRRRAPDCPPEVEALCLSALVRDPGARPADGEAFALALDACLEGRAPRAARGRLAPALAGLTGAAALAGLGAALLLLRPRGAAPDGAEVAATGTRPVAGGGAAPPRTTAPPPPEAATWRPPALRFEELAVPPEGTVARITYEFARGEPRVASTMAKFYDAGESGVAQDPAAARRWSYWGASRSDADSVAMALELVDRRGESGPGERAHWLAELARVSSDPGLPDKERGIAHFVLACNGLDRRAHLEEATRLGHGRATVHLAELVAPGDPVRARALLEGAADEDEGWVQLAGALERGLGGPRDLQRAVALYRRALGRNDPDACLALGRLILDGAAPPRDPDEARQLLERAAARPELLDAARAQLARLRR